MSPIWGEIDKLSGGVISGQKALRDEVGMGSDAWLENLVSQYLRDRSLAARMTSGIVRPNSCEASRFYSVFQPANPWPPVREHWDKFSEDIRTGAAGPSHLHLAHLEPEMAFSDPFHIDQSSRQRMADEITAWLLRTDPCLKAASGQPQGAQP